MKRSVPAIAIEPDARKQIEKQRLLRMIARHSRPPTTNELTRLDAMLRAIDPSVESGRRFVGMHAVTLVHANLAHLDSNGYGSLKADGVHAHAAFVNFACPLTEPERYDTVLFVLRNGAREQVFAIDRIFVHTRARIMFDGELCLRKKRLSPEEFRAINSAQNVHTRSYLLYPEAADADAVRAGVNITSAEHQAQYDDQFELAYAAFDCMFFTKRQTTRPFSERLALVHELTETSPAVDTTIRFRKRVDQIMAAVAYAGGADRFAIRIFMKPMFSVQHTRAAMHAVPACMHGIGTDGVIFNRADSPYIVGVNERLLKWKVEHTADFVIVKLPRTIELVPQKYELCVSSHDNKLAPVAASLLLDTNNARELVQQYAVEHGRRGVVIECVGIVSADFTSNGVPLVLWRPIQARTDKGMPNQIATYVNVLAAVVNPTDEKTVVAYLQNRNKPIE